MYLGTDIGKVDYGDGYFAWRMILGSYVKEDIRNLKNV